MKRATIAAAAALLALAGTAPAHALNYSYAEVDYERVDLDDIDVAFKGFGLSGSWLLNDDFYLRGRYSNSETSSFSEGGLDGRFSLEQFSAGLGWRHGLAPQTDLNIGAAFERQRVKGRRDFGAFGSDSDNGFSVSAGLRHLLIPELELNAEVRYIDVIDDDTLLTVGALGHFTPNFAVRGSYTIGSDWKGFNIGLRLKF
jgi:opacity protein-like surface antigen